jgi:hypothetical protein
MTNWMFTTNHKRIGIFYIWFGLFSGLLGMMLALAIRLELSSPGNQVFENNKWVVNVILTAHSFIMFSLVGIKCYMLFKCMPSLPYPTWSHFLYLMWLYCYIKGYCEFGGLTFVDNKLYAAYECTDPDDPHDPDGLPDGPFWYYIPGIILFCYLSYKLGDYMDNVDLGNY